MMKTTTGFDGFEDTGEREIAPCTVPGTGHPVLALLQFLTGGWVI